MNARKQNGTKRHGQMEDSVTNTPSYLMPYVPTLNNKNFHKLDAVKLHSLYAEI